MRKLQTTFLAIGVATILTGCGMAKSPSTTIIENTETTTEEMTSIIESDGNVNISEWKQVGDYHWIPVKCFVEGKDISYTYDENDMRSAKCVNGEKTTYVYEKYVISKDGCDYINYKLVSETNGDKDIRYIYDDTDVGKMKGFIYEGAEYTYLYDENGNIFGIAQGEETIGTYSYDENYVSTTNYDLSDNGIMSINHIRFDGFYLDDETGYYYAGGKYNDLKNGRLVNKKIETEISIPLD